MKFKLLLTGVALFVLGLIGYGTTCPSSSCPTEPVPLFFSFLTVAGMLAIPLGVVWWLANHRWKPAPPIPPDPSAFIDDLAKRLTSEGFTGMRGVDLPPYRLDILAARTKFEATKFGKTTIFVVASKADRVDVSMIKDYSSAVTKYALNRPNEVVTALATAISWRSVAVFPVIVSEDSDETAKKWANETLAPKHWKGFEFPVLVSTRQGRAYFCRKTPVWGAAYYRGFRRFVESLIGS